MSQISVVHYNPSSQHKFNILQQNTSTNNNNNAVKNDRQVIVLRKPPNILPQPKDFSKDDILLTNTAKKGSKKSTREPKSNAQPVAVARRNARERNRVKQVNNGFANLRQHIPNFIAQAFESNNGRGGNKKLSKVETLRMAVEYIRNLEDILAADGCSSIEPKNESEISYPSPSSSFTSPNDQSSKTYSFIMSPSEDDDDLSSIATPSPQQYIKINTSNNTYEIIPSNLYENTENLDPILSDPNLIDPSNIGFGVNSHDLSYLNINSLHHTTTCSLSPGLYSEDSLSPNVLERSDQNCFIPVFNSERLSPNINVQIKTEVNDLPVISLKTENDLPESQKNLVDVINWWENQPQQNGS